MLYPSYIQLREKIKQNSSDEYKPSRYSIVIAAAKRARQIVDGDKVLVNTKVNKPVSIAVEELYQGKVTIKTKTNQVDLSANIENQNEMVNTNNVIDNDQYSDNEQ
ncbi:DNA-directed RNA polymerase subunit omega [Defluviitalea raffinosedens]|uniref:DNA-directed RNA polymerase subunit omega n=1 Tax=Defluviitalea raffinosedens TaxID=1450156 RepID=A0A7C8HGE7_9FIRM|nr:DNA-directed RNA polymerase subunit omega [Defluviitalea raffinosedens]KAE9637209.1 DNA-directed RNA polymerase subunit omega [Defluviitalea raffinosedens]